MTGVRERQRKCQGEKNRTRYQANALPAHKSINSTVRGPQDLHPFFRLAAAEVEYKYGWFLRTRSSAVGEANSLMDFGGGVLTEFERFFCLVP